MGNAKQSNQTLIMIFLQFCGHNPDCFNILIEMVNHKSQHRLQKLAIEVEVTMVLSPGSGLGCFRCEPKTESSSSLIPFITQRALPTTNLATN